jgi:hypothetical protein
MGLNKKKELSMEARQVNAGNGWNWIKEGFAIFRENPVIWIALFFIYLLIGMGLSVIPLVGPIVLNLLAPVFMAGFMIGCRALESGEELELNHLFAGFKQNTAQLVTVGGLYLAGIIMIVGLIALSGGEALMAKDAQVTEAMGNKALLAALTGLVLLLPLVMAYWFAPTLVVFHDMKALDAMKLSFNACLRNVVPFLVYSLLTMGLMLLAMIPLGLGLLVMIPTMTASLYASYKDVFNISALQMDEVLSED